MPFINHSEHTSRNERNLATVYQNRHPLCTKVVVSKETVVLRRWGSSIQKFGFINGVDNVNSL